MTHHLVTMYQNNKFICKRLSGHGQNILSGFEPCDCDCECDHDQVDGLPFPDTSKVSLSLCLAVAVIQPEFWGESAHGFFLASNINTKLVLHQTRA